MPDQEAIKQAREAITRAAEALADADAALDKVDPEVKGKAPFCSHCGLVSGHQLWCPERKK